MSLDASILLRSDDSSDVVSAIEISVPAGWEGPPLHHHAFDEAFYILDGELTFQLDDQLLTGRTGELIFAPRDRTHTLTNLSDRAARYLLICTPGGFERRFDPDDDRPRPAVHTVGPTIPERLASG
jgi:quercetin dioxygenase-like cupin family protein